MSNKQKKSQLGEKALRFAFGALLIAATIGLFLISDAGRRLFAGDSAHGAAMADTPAGTLTARVTARQTEPPAPLPQELIDAAKQNGAAGSYALVSEDKDALAYVVTREGLGEVSLTLLVGDGRVYGFALAGAIVLMPTPPASPTPIEGDFYEQGKEACRADLQWFEDAFFALAEALGAGDGLSRAQLEGLYWLACDTRGDGKRRDASEGGFDFAVSRGEGDEDGMLRLVFCRKR